MEQTDCADCMRFNHELKKVTKEIVDFEQWLNTSSHGAGSAQLVRVQQQVEEAKRRQGKLTTDFLAHKEQQHAPSS